MGKSKWRDPRYAAQIAVDLLQGEKRIAHSYTTNVSMRGAFIVTNDPPPLRTLMRVRFVLPPDNQPVVLHCMAAHVVPPGVDVPIAGVGVQLYGVGGVDGTRWSHFVRWLRAEHPEGLDPTMNLPTQLPEEEKKGLDPAFDGRIKLRFRSTDELRRLYDTNIQRGGLMLPTKGEVPEGTELELALVHPEGKTSFPLRGKVRQNVQRADFTGISVQLTDLTTDIKERLYDFVHADISISIDVSSSVISAVILPESAIIGPHEEITKLTYAEEATRISHEEVTRLARFSSARRAP